MLGRRGLQQDPLRQLSHPNPPVVLLAYLLTEDTSEYEQAFAKDDGGRLGPP